MTEAHPLPIRLGEKRPFYGKATAPTGSTHTVDGTSTVTLYDKDGAVAGGINAVSVTGQETGAQLELLVWYLLDPSNPPSGIPLTPGVYHLVFKPAATGSDTIQRVFEPAVFIIVNPAYV